MESAGRAATHVIAREFAEHLSDGVLLAAGPGNNGGDGWVVARALRRLGVPVSACETPKKRSADCEANRALALAEGVTLLEPGGSWPATRLLVDAILGTGASGAPRGELGELAERVAVHGAPVAAIDGPTGLDLTTGEAHGPVRAALTVTFGGLRRGHLLARDWVGKVAVVDIGFPEPDPVWPLLVTDRWSRVNLPPFESTMHKGSRGRLLVIGGAQGMAGAAMHVARAAFACGVGLVKLALDEVSIGAAQANFSDALTVTTQLGPDLEAELVEAIEWADAIVLGPGFGRGDARREFAAKVMAQAIAPMVIDADALHMLAGKIGLGSSPRVLTPHPGEFASLFPDLADMVNRDRFEAAEQGYQRLTSAPPPPSPPSSLLLKGVPTVIADQSGLRVVATGNAALATGGSGDLLAGCIGAWLARGLAPGDAAALGAQAMGRAAEAAVRAHTVRATRPEDVAGEFPDLWRQWAEMPAPVPPVLVTLYPPALD